MVHGIFIGDQAVRRTGLSSGYAAAVRPAAETAIATSDDGLIVGDVLIPTSDGSIPAYSARPSDGRDFPLIVVIHEIFGVHEHIKDVCRRFAQAGYCAVAPELFARQGDLSGLTDFSEILKIVSKAPDSVVLTDIDATVSYALEHCGADSERVCTVGFCWGGRVVWLYAAHSDDVKAGAALYGRLVGQHSELQPKFPVDVAGSLKAPVLGLYGALDQGIPLETVDTMWALLETSGTGSSIKVYPEAGHAFYADYRPSYNAEAAADAWKSMLTFFAEKGV